MHRALDTFRLASLAVALALTGCMDRELTGMDPVVQAVTELEIVQPPSGKVDILVVVDNSRSMEQEQRALAANFPLLIQQLMNPSDPVFHAVTDLNIGVVSTDLGSAGYPLSTCDSGMLGYAGGDDGCFRNTPAVGTSGCAAGYPSFLHRGPENVLAYGLDQMGADFACVATLGTGGCGFEQQMEAARKALVEKTAVGGCNAGFLRDDSILAVLWVTDEEDCSVQDPTILNPALDAELGHPNVRCPMHPELLKPVPAMIDQLRALRHDPRNFVLAMIVGVPVGSRCEGRGEDLEGCLGLPEMQYRLLPSMTDIEPSCTNPSGWGFAYPARRFVEAAQLVGHNALVRSICNDDWRPAMNAVLELIHGAMDRVCFPHELVLDPETCRSECTVIETLSDDRACPAGRTEADPPTETDRDGMVHRRCVVPQAVRLPNADGSCPATATSGWYYVPRDDVAGTCDQVLFAADSVSEPQSETNLECLTYVCPADRRCGSASNPGGRCCGTDETCVDVDPLSGGRCVPAF